LPMYPWKKANEANWPISRTICCDQGSLEKQ
jgi:hypothetical protein